MPFPAFYFSEESMFPADVTGKYRPLASFLLEKQRLCDEGT
jgi:hypothetical protein